MEQYPDVVVLLRCRYRTWQLYQSLCSLIRQNWKILLLPDRPTDGVLTTIDVFKDVDNLEIVPVNDDCTGHRWAKAGMRGLNVGLNYIDEHKIRPKWCLFRDDDEDFHVGDYSAIHKCLQGDHTLAWSATSLYLWDDPEQVNVNLLHHSPIFFRYRTGDRFPEDGRSTQTTEPIQKRILRNPYRERTLPVFLLDYSVMKEDERREQIERFRQSGKDDGYTRAFSKPPKLMDLNEIRAKWTPFEFAAMQMRERGILNE